MSFTRPSHVYYPVKDNVLILYCPGLHAALSPNATVLFALDEHHSPIMDLLQYNAPLDEHAMSDST